MLQSLTCDICKLTNETLMKFYMYTELLRDVTKKTLFDDPVVSGRHSQCGRPAGRTHVRTRVRCHGDQATNKNGGQALLCSVTSYIKQRVGNVGGGASVTLLSSARTLEER